MIANNNFYDFAHNSRTAKDLAAEISTASCV